MYETEKYTSKSENIFPKVREMGMKLKNKHPKLRQTLLKLKCIDRNQITVYFCEIKMFKF